MTTNNKNNNSLIELSLVGILIFLLISIISFKNFSNGLRLSLTYLIFIYIPFLPIISKLKLGLIEKFVLNNMLGLSYGLIFVLIDIFLNIPLSKGVYIVVTFIVTILSIYYPNISKSIKKFRV
jgi:hypothetical protein